MQSSYQTFLIQKQMRAHPTGREVRDDKVSPVLYDFQRDITRWALRHGRCAVWADTGLGKSYIEIEFARLVGGRVLKVRYAETARINCERALSQRKQRGLFDAKVG